jgi:RsiW-degrading membrane proteinase PrsW (M82 family)
MTFIWIIIYRFREIAPLRGKGILERNTSMTGRLVSASFIVILAAVIAAIFVSALGRALHVRLTPEGTFFLVGSMLIGSIISVAAANLIVSICRQGKEPPLCQ